MFELYEKNDIMKNDKKGAGHNSNTDRPEEINGIIDEFVSLL